MLHEQHKFEMEVEKKKLDCDKEIKVFVDEKKCIIYATQKRKKNSHGLTPSDD